MTRYGSYTSYNDTIPALDQTYPAEWITGLSASYFMGPWAFSAYGENVGDNYPDQTQFASDNHGSFPYSELTPFGFNGAFYSVRVTYSW